MKKLLVLLCFIPAISTAQSVDIKDVNAKSDETTTIQIRKGEAAVSPDAKWEVSEGDSDIEGEAFALVKEAKQSWKTACDQWKKEFRADNKENKIINVSCGTANCKGASGTYTCTSKAAYKVKTKVQ